MNYIVFDLEATCWEQHDRSDNEIIEIGALKISDQLEIVSEFQTFVKPLKYPILSDFCKKLTTIRQEEVDNAPHFYEVIPAFKAWIGEEYQLCSWGYYDQRQLVADCQLSNLDHQWTRHHISIKHQHGRIRQLKRPLGMMRALQLEGMQATGTHHCGIDDARNIAKIFIKCFPGFVFSS